MKAERASGKVLGPQRKDRCVPSQEEAGEILQLLGWSPNSPEARGEWGMGMPMLSLCPERGGRRVWGQTQNAQPSPLPYLFSSRAGTGRLTASPFPDPHSSLNHALRGRSSRNPHLIRSQPASSTPWAPLCPWDEAQAPRSPGHRSFPCPLGPLKSPRSASSLLALSRAQVAPPTAGRTAGTLLALPSAGAFPPELPWCSLLYRRDRSGPGSVRGQRPWGGTGRAPELRVPSRGPRSRP